MADLSGAGVFDRFILRGVGPFALDVPTRPLQSILTDDCAILWLGPDEWLILVDAGDGPALAARLHAASGPMSLVDVSDRQIGLRLDGGDAALLLNGAVPLDLAPAAFPPGMCVRTILEKAEIVLWRRADAAWHVEVARSFAPYVRDLLAVIADANGIPLRSASAEQRVVQELEVQQQNDASHGP